MTRVKAWWKLVVRDKSVPEDGSASSLERTKQLEARCAEFEERLRSSDDALRDRTEVLYDLQRQYAKEHFALFESARDLKTERLRNAGAHTSRDTILKRARALQARISELKQRLRAHETVEDLHFDESPILIEARAPEP